MCREETAHSLTHCLQDELVASGEIKLLRNGPNDSTLIVFTDDYRTYIVKHLHSVAVKKTLVGLCMFHALLIMCERLQ